MIPSWQMSADPGVNIKLNPNVTFPPGWTQSTIQPVGPAYAAARIAEPQLSGLAARGRLMTCCCNNACTSTDESCCTGSGVFSRIKRAVGIRGLRGLGTVNTSTALIIGGVGLLAAAGVGAYAYKHSHRRRR